MADSMSTDVDYIETLIEKNIRNFLTEEATSLLNQIEALNVTGVKLTNRGERLKKKLLNKVNEAKNSTKY